MPYGTARPTDGSGMPRFQVARGAQRRMTAVRRLAGRGIAGSRIVSRKDPSILLYVLLESERPEVTVLRRGTGWEPELFAGLAAELAMPEIGIVVPLSEIYAR